MSVQWSTLATAPQMLLLGPPELASSDGCLAFVAERRYQLLALLALHAGQWVPRERIAGLLWPERSDADARRNLRHVVFKARALPGVANLEANDHALRWTVATDLQAFDSALRAGLPAQAIGLRRGVLLDGIDDPDNAELCAWLQHERLGADRRWQQAALDALTVLREPRQRIALAQQLLSLDPLDEAALAALLRDELALGETARASRHYRDYAHRLADELGVEPSHALRDLLGASLQAAPPEPPAASAPDPQFVGRRLELNELAQLLAQPDARLVTIVGPGGIGKSRLARHAMQAAEAVFPGGRGWIELQDLVDAPALLARLAAQIGAPIDDARDPIAQLGRRLSGARTLCVLDNAEHLSGLPALIGRLLDAAPALVLLVTSRARTHEPHERVLLLGGLAVPDDESRDPEAAGAFDAVRLFAMRAAVAQPGFALASHLEAVIDIVESVGGLPLAIELAAAWVRLLPAEEIARDLHRSLDVLERDPAAPGAPARPEHRSLREVLERSWRLLAPGERDALSALAVFQGGFTRAAALAVVRAPLPLLSSLADKSLLTVDATGRFGMHSLVAADAAERLGRDATRAAELAQRHAEHFAGFVAGLASQADADHQPVVVGIEAEYANCRAAWQHAVAYGLTRFIAPAVGAWRVYFEVRGRTGAGIAHFQAALEFDTREPGREALAADVRSALSRMHYLRGEHQTGLAIAESGAELAERCGDRRALFRCLTNAGSCHSAQAHWTAARSCFERALALARADGATIEIATALSNLGIVAKNEGRWDDALGCYAQALAIERELGRQAAVVRCLSTLGGMHLSRGDWLSARQCMDEGLRLSERYHVDFFVPIHACGLGEALLELGELADARRCLQRALECSRKADNPMIAVHAQANLGRVATLQGDPVAAIAHLRAAIRSASERGWTNMCLNIALLFGEALRDRGLASDAARVWRMVAAHPQADAGMRDRAQRWCDALVALPATADRDPMALAEVTDRLLSDRPLDAAASSADKR